MTPELKADPETLRQAEVISKQMASTAWDELDRWFWTAKIEAIETAEVADIDINDLPNADDGHLVPFIEVFPLGLSLNFTFEKAAWAADEQVLRPTAVRMHGDRPFISSVEGRDRTENHLAAGCSRPSL